MVDPRLVSAVALLIIGLAMCGFVIRIWQTHPINRVFLVGEYITEKGLRFLLRYALVTAFAGGLYALSMSAAKFAYALRWIGHEAASSYADAFGTIEAIFSVWAASGVLWAVVQLGRRG